MKTLAKQYAAAINNGIEPGRPLAPEASGEAGRACYAHFPGLISHGLCRAALFISLSLCAGCASLTHFLPHENRYFRVYCLSQSQLDQLKKSQPGKVHDSLTGEADKDTRILAGSLIRVRAHDDGLLEVLGGCTDPNK